MKPNDIFLGVVELFSIFIPGLVFIYLVNAFFPGAQEMIIKGIKLDDAGKTISYIIFAILAYIAGHILFAIGAAWDEMYDWIQENRKPPAGTKLKGFTKLRYFYTPGNNDPLIEQVQAIRARRISRLDSDSINNYQWSRAMVSINHPGGYQEILRKEADSKLFRSLLLPLVLLGCYAFYTASPTVGIIMLISPVLAYMRYSKERFRGCKIAYTHVIALHQLGKI